MAFGVFRPGYPADELQLFPSLTAPCIKSGIMDVHHDQFLSADQWKAEQQKAAFRHEQALGPCIPSRQGVANGL